MGMKCYRPDEILELNGNEPHLIQCQTCRERHELAKAFHARMKSAEPAASAAAASWEADREARRWVDAVSLVQRAWPGAAVPEPVGATPELVLACCEQSRHALLKSPNEAQGWLEWAEAIMARTRPTADLRRDRDRRWAELRLIATRGNLLMARGHIHPAHALLEEARKGFSDLGDEFQAALSARSIAFTLVKSGLLLDAAKLCSDAIRTLRDYGAGREELLMMNNLALVCLPLSEHRKARLIFDYLVTHLGASDPFVFTVRRNAAVAVLEAGDREEALRRANALAAELAGGDLELEKARTGRLQGEILLLMGHAERALKMLRKAEKLLRPLEAGYEMAQLNALLGQAHLLSGRNGEARNFLRRALDFFTNEGFALDLVHLLESWSLAADEGRSADRDFAAFRHYWQFGPAMDVSPS
jgi:tetratricopeptide (TPR) repeat protein